MGGYAQGAGAIQQAAAAVAAAAASSMQGMWAQGTNGNMQVCFLGLGLWAKYLGWALGWA